MLRAPYHQVYVSIGPPRKNEVLEETKSWFLSHLYSSSIGIVGVCANIANSRANSRIFFKEVVIIIAGKHKIPALKLSCWQQYLISIAAYAFIDLDFIEILIFRGSIQVDAS